MPQVVKDIVKLVKDAELRRTQRVYIFRIPLSKWTMDTTQEVQKCRRNGQCMRLAPTINKIIQCIRQSVCFRVRLLACLLASLLYASPHSPHATDSSSLIDGMGLQIREDVKIVMYTFTTDFEREIIISTDLQHYTFVRVIAQEYADKINAMTSDYLEMSTEADGAHLPPVKREFRLQRWDAFYFMRAIL